jgi:predicted secreted hydrolase
VNPARRAWLQQLALRAGVALPWLAHRDAPAASAGGIDTRAAFPVRRGRPLQFPQDHGAHPGTGIEWWYATGWLQSGADPAPTAPATDAGLLGFQLTFFRSRTGLAGDNPSRFAARHLLFAHAAVTTLESGAGRHRHAQRIGRWNGQPGARAGAAALDDGRVHLGDWKLQRAGPAAQTVWAAELPSADFGLSLLLKRTQPVLLQGDAGFSRKGPEERQASHYYSEPQLAVSGRVRLEGRAVRGEGRAWLDHEWSDAILHPDAVGWDWIGFNLFDGSALTVFQLRRRDGTPLWAGGSFRAPGAAVTAFAPTAARFTPERWWTSPTTRARYPVQWRVEHPAGRHTVRALLDAQELDGRSGTGTVYWEGVSELLDTQGQRVGLGYLEMTGYSGRLQL